MSSFALVFQSFTHKNPVQLHSNGVGEIPKFDSLVFTVFPHILMLPHAVPGPWSDYPLVFEAIAFSLLRGINLYGEGIK
jgi:hypothetical protein